MTEVLAWLDERAEEMAALVEALVRDPHGEPAGPRARALRGSAARRARAAGLRARADRGPVERARDRRRRERGRLLPRALRRRPGAEPSQFAPVRRDGRIVGRGTADMKGGLVSMLYGAAAARELGLLDGRRIVLHFVCDEETGSTAGSGHLREAGLIDPGAVAMLTAEPTGGVIWNASARRDHAAGDDLRPGGARRLRQRGRQRVRAHDPHRRAAHRALARAARAGLDAPGRGAGGRRRRVQRRARARPGSPSTAASTPTRSSTRSSRG